MQALIVIDVQNDFCPGGALAVAGGDEIVPGITALMAQMDAVVLTQEWRPAGHCGFFENDHSTPTGLHGYLQTRGVTQLTCVGIATDFCVNYTAVDAAKLGYTVEVRQELCRGIDFDGSLAAAKDAMDAAGVRRI